MTLWHELIRGGSSIPEWPYPIRYDKKSEISTDVLVLGGGIAGCHAAINAARKGVRVVVVEKGATKRSGAGGAGVDHWHAACTNPCSEVTPEEYTRAIVDSMAGYTCGIARYIDALESWDTLLDCERMGMQIRDVKDEFKGAEFRDEETKLLFAYDYDTRISLRVFGHNVKPCLYNELKRLGVTIYDRVMVTSLLTEGGKQGNKVVGATGINVRTGEFYVFKAKATVVCTGGVTRLWVFAPELLGPTSRRDLNEAGVGQVIGWKAGAELTLMEQSTVYVSYFGYAAYSVGNAANTWYGTPIVDADGKEIPYVNKDGKELGAWDERFRPAPTQKFSLDGGIGIIHRNQEFCGNRLDPNLPERILSGEFRLPLYADLSRLPLPERKAIFGMMVGNEGRTRIPIYYTYTRAGFDPDRDMLQVPVMPPEEYRNPCFWMGLQMPQLRGIGGAGPGSGYLVDWDLRTTLEGLYAAGVCIAGSGCHASAAVSGRYAGRKAAAYAKIAPEPAVDHKQVESEKARVYAPLKQKGRDAIGWKELNHAIARIMQDYCSQYKSEGSLALGLKLLGILKETADAKAYADNPHELGRLLECFSLIEYGEMVMHASLARKASSNFLDFRRLDYPQLDPPEWHKLLSIRLEEDKVKVKEQPVDYHLKSPNAPTYEENYKHHCGLEGDYND